jgi:hypothetical protein
MGDSFSVVIRDFDILRLIVFPAETDPILIVDADAVLAVPLARQSFEPQTRNVPQIRQSFRVSQNCQLYSSGPLDLLKSPDANAIPELLRFLVPKRHLPTW